jgi:ribosomal protein S18 acetylase RimI-like enzyme
VPVRDARPTDAERIAKVAETAWHAAYGDFLPDDAIEETVAEWYDPPSLRDSIDRDDGGFVIYETTDPEGGDTPESRVVGFLQAGYRESVGNVVLGRIYVLPDYWGEGVGSAMLERVVDDLRAAGRERISAVVLADNEVGRAFYDARGFAEVDRQTSTFGGIEREELIVAADLATPDSEHAGQ